MTAHLRSGACLLIDEPEPTSVLGLDEWTASRPSISSGGQEESDRPDQRSCDFGAGSSRRPSSLGCPPRLANRERRPKGRGWPHSPGPSGSERPFVVRRAGARRDRGLDQRPPRRLEAGAGGRHALAASLFAPTRCSPSPWGRRSVIVSGQGRGGGRLGLETLV
jgi:hypothetical protein